MSPCVFDVSALGEAHPVFDLGEGLLDRIEVWGIGRQEPQPCPGDADDLADGLGLVAAEIVHDDNVAGAQGGAFSCSGPAVGVQ